MRPFPAALLCVPLIAFASAATALAGLGSNPANHDRLISKPIEKYAYDRGTRCRAKPKPGVRKLARWLGRHTSGTSWGIYRCEKWGRRSFSLHAESRAIDWHMDARVRSQKRQAMKLIRKRLLATDSRGNENALARRMGVQGIIFNCRSWFSGSGGLGDYSYCLRRNGKRKPMRKLDPTQAHVDHIHIELNKRGARGRTSFWRSSLG